MSRRGRRPCHDRIARVEQKQQRIVERAAACGGRGGVHLDAEVSLGRRESRGEAELVGLDEAASNRITAVVADPSP
jgi:hypothetical protein